MSSVGVLTRNGGAALLAILTFSIPSNLLVEYIFYHSYEPDDLGAFFRISSVVSALVIPLYAIVIVQAASATLSRSDSTYGSLIGSSLENWARIFKARFLATVMVGLGTLFLIVPGIILAIRFAFVEVLAIEEGLNGSEARRRSTELASGRAPVILRLLAVVFGTVVLAAFLTGFLLGLWPQYDHFVIAALGDAVFDILVSTVYGGAWFIYSATEIDREADRVGSLPEPIA